MMGMPRGGRLFLATCLCSLFVLVLYFQSITKPDTNSKCQAAVCECDKAVAECFAQKPYNPQYKDLDNAQCAD